MTINIPKIILRLIFGKRLPRTNGKLVLPGIRDTVLVRRDRYGTAYISAGCECDAWYGLGFCHGQDRAFQLELLLRVVRGTLSEILGPRTLAIDRLSRRIGFARSAAAQWEHLAEEHKQVIRAYTGGISAGSRVGCSRKAHEFALLGTAPSAFTGSDVLGVLKLLSFTLSANWDMELARLRILLSDGAEALKALDPACLDDDAAAAHGFPGLPAAIDRLERDVARFTALTGGGGGSNNWVIAPNKTRTGRPLLANDPHLAPMLPPYWYLATIHTPDWRVAGASFVGAPCFPAGHNQKAGWGMTAGLVDNTDFFIEQIGPDGQSVRRGNGFVPCRVLREIITVKGRKPVTEEVLLSPHGPVVGPALDGDFAALALRATWLDNGPVNGLLRIHKAASFAEFRRAFKDWPALSLNMVYADTGGSIGWQLAGHAPRRKKGHGAVPRAGFDPDTGWKERHVPFNRMPHVQNPPEGFIVTANNRPTSEGNMPFLGVDWLDHYRKTRISECVSARNDWDPAAARALQTDKRSIPWAEIRDIVLGLESADPDVRQALELLKNWDGTVSAGSSAAAVYELFMAEMIGRIVRRRAPRAARWALGKGFSPLITHSFLGLRRYSHLVSLVRARPGGWFHGSWEDEMQGALKATAAALRGRYGPRTEKWTWGGVRPLVLPHALGEQYPFSRIFNLGPFPCGGDATTVNQTAVDLNKVTANPLVTVSLRMVLDIGNWDENSFSLPGGQSGNPFSPHYADLLNFWRQGRGISLAWSEEETVSRTRSTLELVPGGRN